MSSRSNRRRPVLALVALSLALASPAGALAVGDPDTTPPSGTLVIAGGAAWTSSPSVSLNVAATDAGSGVSLVELSNDGLSWTTRAYAPTQAWTLAAGTGTRTVFARWRDVAGNLSAAKSDTILLDTSPPTISSAEVGVATGGGFAATGALPLLLTWTGADAGTGIARYELGQQLDGGAWTTVSTTLTGPSVGRSLAAGHAVRFRLRAVDQAGNVGAWRTIGSSTGAIVADSAATTTGTWTSVASAGATGGTLRHTSHGTATASYTFSGRAVGWLAQPGPAFGIVHVYVDGAFVGTVDLLAGSVQARQVVFSRTWAVNGTHTIRLVNAGTPGRPAMNVDGFLVLAGPPTGGVTIVR